jgi:hypothetical protein
MRDVAELAAVDNELYPFNRPYVCHQLHFVGGLQLWLPLLNSVCGKASLLPFETMDFFVSEGESA